MIVRHLAAAALVGAALLPRAGGAQLPGAAPPSAPAGAPRRIELRADVTTARVRRIEGSAGVVLPAGTYVRVAVLGGVGIGEDRRERFTAYRGDAVVRFQLDPFHQAKAGVYGGAGVAWLGGSGRRGTAYLALSAGVEFREWGPVTPAIEAGVGGGARVGVVLRSASRRWR